MPTNQSNQYSLKLDFSQLDNVTESDIGKIEEANLKQKVSNIGKFFISQGIQPAIEEALNLASTKINIISGNEQEIQRWQLKVNAIKGAVNTAISSLGTFAGLTAIGMSNPVALAVTVGLKVMEAGFNYLSESNRINSLKAVENKQIEQINQRSGWIYNKSRQGA